MDRLSSNYLFHYKTDVNVIKLILEKGFRHSMWDEKVIFRDSVQQNFVVCFCDILAEHSAYHKQCYGNNALVLKKEWGIQNSISPMRYVHNNSIGQSPEYIKLKNINREMWIKNVNGNHYHQYAIDYLAMKMAKDSNLMPQPSIAQSLVNNPNLVKFLGDFDVEFDGIESELKKTGKDKVLYKFFHSIGSLILELHNELEKRDAYMRVYKDDFPCPAMAGSIIPDKVLYDEREWRSVKFIGNLEFKDNPKEYQDAVSNRFLPERFNLKFTSGDFIALLVTTEKEKEDMLDFIKNNKTQLDYSKDKDKVMLYGDFKE